MVKLLIVVKECVNYLMNLSVVCLLRRDGDWTTFLKQSWSTRTPREQVYARQNIVTYTHKLVYSYAAVAERHSPPRIRLGVCNIEINEDKLQKLRDDKSLGADELVPRFLSIIGNELVHPLTWLYQKIIENEMVPSDWKDANVMCTCCPS